MSMHVSKFLDRVRAAESSGRKDVIIPLQEARDLHAEITRILLRLEQSTQSATTQEPSIQVEIRAPDF